MAGNRCINFSGERLDGATVCLFDAPPSDAAVAEFRYGVFDVCYKKKFPPPQDCRPLIGTGDIIAEIPFKKVLGYYPYTWFAGYPDLYYDSEEALAGMWADGADGVPDPLADVFYFDFLFQVAEWYHGLFYAGGQVNEQRMFIPVAELDPFWLPGHTISFSVVGVSPVVSGAPSWASVFMGNKSIPFNSGPFEIPVAKNPFYQEGHELKFTCGPTGFDYRGYCELPLFQGGPVCGWSYRDMAAFNLRLRVRLAGLDYKACWPEHILNKRKFLAVVDTFSGLVIGPPIKIN
jgi:hypothetical protein